MHSNTYCLGFILFSSGPNFLISLLQTFLYILSKRWCRERLTLWDSNTKHDAATSSITSATMRHISYLAMATFSLSDYGRITVDEPRERQFQRMQNRQERKENESTFLTLHDAKKGAWERPSIFSINFHLFPLLHRHKNKPINSVTSGYCVVARSFQGLLMVQQCISRCYRVTLPSTSPPHERNGRRPEWQLLFWTAATVQQQRGVSWCWGVFYLLRQRAKRY